VWPDLDGWRDQAGVEAACLRRVSMYYVAPMDRYTDTYQRSPTPLGRPEALLVLEDARCDIQLEAHGHRRWNVWHRDR